MSVKFDLSPEEKTWFDSVWEQGLYRIFGY